MDEKKFDELPENVQNNLSSQYRKTVHDGEIVFINDDTAKSLTHQEVKEQLIKQRNDLLESLGFKIDENEIDNNYPRQRR